eukprot:TRINITY_DN28622_c0_g1_i1.p1 TRINITY_DN28622_c0_g1~~TRINITY_DN28622_c0_g1_i1.p1  ORF type:complete len:545 (+),score=167.17 TRINITY_DN28622_c0_g1_i1:56-1636(+)
MTAPEAPSAPPPRHHKDEEVDPLLAYQPAVHLQSMLAGLESRPTRPFGCMAQAVRAARDDPIRSVSVRTVLGGYKGNWCLEVAVQNGRGRAATAVCAPPPRPKSVVAYGAGDCAGGLDHAVEAVRATAGPALLAAASLDAAQVKVDDALCGSDGTRNLERTGAAAIFACSMSYARAAALPTPAVPQCLPADEEVPLWQFLRLRKPEPPFGNPGQLRDTVWRGPPGGTAAPATLPIPCVTILESSGDTSSHFPCEQICVACWGCESVAACLEVLHRVNHLVRTRLPEVAVGPLGAPINTFVDIRECLEFVSGVLLDVKQDDEVPRRVELRVIVDVASVHLTTPAGVYDLLTKVPREQAAARRLISTEALLSLYDELASEGLLHGVVDPVKPDDEASWMQLRQRIPNLLLLGASPVQGNEDRLTYCTERRMLDGAALHPRDCGTVSGWLWFCMTAWFLKSCVAVQCGVNEAMDLAAAQCAIAGGAALAMFGGLELSEHTALWNELLRAEEWSRQRGVRPRLIPPAVWQ